MAIDPLRTQLESAQPIQAICHHDDGFEHPSDGKLPCSLVPCPQIGCNPFATGANCLDCPAVAPECDPDALEAILQSHFGTDHYTGYWKRVIAAVTPLIRAQAFTEAANAVEIRVAISDPGRYTPRKRAGYQPDESLAQWQARAVGIVIRGLSEGTENA